MLIFREEEVRGSFFTFRVRVSVAVGVQGKMPDPEIFGPSPVCLSDLVLGFVLVLQLPRQPRVGTSLCDDIQLLDAEPDTLLSPRRVRGLAHNEG